MGEIEKSLKGDRRKRFRDNKNIVLIYLSEKTVLSIVDWVVKKELEILTMCFGVSNSSRKH
ncbi:hypothetical protein B6U74_03335 [Candidatus Bathyarchaeota archaeon ex4484_205]|nr:MAG: hypothetical protein B6U74_03335 [Candidatus Bathyarchaeota archaeon ex4484_205]